MTIRTYLAGLIAVVCCSFPSIAIAKDVAIAMLSDKSAKITVAKNRQCAPKISVTLEADDASFFDDRLQELGSLYGAALSRLTFDCPKLDHISIRGITSSVELVQGHSRKNEGWRLKLDQSNLSKQALGLAGRITTFDNISDMVTQFAPYRSVKGIEKTSGYAQYARASKAVIEQLTDDRLLFSSFVERATLKLNKQKADKQVETAIRIVELYKPKYAKELRNQALEIGKKTLRTAALQSVEKALNEAKTIKAKIASVAAHLDKKRPDADTISEIDLGLATWIEEEVSKHEQKNSGTYLNAVRANMKFAASVGKAQIGDLLPHTQAVTETINFWFDALADEMLDENFQDAKILIAGAGRDYREIDLIFETSLALSEEFVRHGFDAKAQDLLAFARLQIKSKIEEGLKRYKDQLSREKMTLDRVAFYKAEADLFHDLSNEYPGFANYVELIDQAIMTGQSKACLAITRTLEKKNSKDLVANVGGQSHSLKSLVCSLYNNGHLLTDFSVSKGRDLGSISVLVDNEQEVIFEVAVNGESKSFTGVAADWEDRMQALVIPPPSGKPDRNGVTECDRLAGDPNDESLRTDGVILDDLSLDYDFERTIDACIAAVEHDPAATRQVYQLARILEFLGNQKTARHYLELAVSRNYAPAIHLQAFSILTHRNDDDAFFDAIDLLKVSSGQGYEPSKKELAALMPKGANLFREIPPPSSSEILSTVGKKRKLNFIGGTNVTVSADRVTHRSCFQTSEKQFSCEIRVRYRCERKIYKDRFGRVGGDNPYVILDMLFVSESRVQADCNKLSKETQFLKFTKTSGGWRHEKEF